MTTVATKLGPGTLTFGEAGSTQEFGSQVTKCELTPSSGESTAVLDGNEVSDDEFTLSGEFFQDYASGMASLIVWCKENAGEPIKFVFTPTSGTGNLKVTGHCVIKPVKFGGEIKKRNTTEFSFPGVGDYTYSAVA